MDIHASICGDPPSAKRITSNLLTRKASTTSHGIRQVGAAETKVESTYAGEQLRLREL